MDSSDIYTQVGSILYPREFTNNTEILVCGRDPALFQNLQCLSSFIFYKYNIFFKLGFNQDDG